MRLALRGGLRCKGEAKMTPEDIKQEMLVLDEEMNSIRVQIDHAKARRFKEGTFADPDWWARANSALRHKGRRRQELQNQLGEMNRCLRAQNKANSDRDDGRAFVRAAKALLTGEMYARIWSEVERERAAA
jgi:hypothetical protein